MILGSIQKWRHRGGEEGGTQDIEIGGRGTCE